MALWCRIISRELRAVDRRIPLIRLGLLRELTESHDDRRVAIRATPFRQMYATPVIELGAAYTP